MNLIVNTAGASRGNPGPSLYDYIIKDEKGVILHQEGRYIGITTNNIAEYSAVINALEYINKNFGHRFPHKIKVVADSELIVRQLSGRYKVKNLRLLEIYRQIKLTEPKLGGVEYHHVLRHENYIADKLANMALNRHQER